MKKRLTEEEAVCSMSIEEALSVGRVSTTKKKAVTNVVNLYRYNDKRKVGYGRIEISLSGSRYKS